MTQLNTPYPATAYLKSYLVSKGKYQVHQKDLGLELILKIFSKKSLERIQEWILKNKNTNHDSVAFFLEAFSDYQNTIEPVIRFLQGKDPSLAMRLGNRLLVPEGPRFLPLQEHDHLLSLFGSMGAQDKAKYIASLYLDDLADVLKYGVDDKFEFSRYGESLAASQTSFENLYLALNNSNTLIDQFLLELIQDILKEQKPDVVALTVPFPGNVYAGLKIGKHLKHLAPKTKIIMGGGFVNTELRDLTDKRLFEFIDYLTFDDGEKPFECLLEYFAGDRSQDKLLRTFFVHNGELKKIFNEGSSEKDVSFKNILAPDYSDLLLDKYVAMLELPNPMHRMWSDFRWNKMILAHGCYWKKCTFCDVTLDYIKRFEPQRAETIVNNLEKVAKQTGSTGFHFVDEAAPPALLKHMSEIIIDRGLKISWWGNLRFDSQFTQDVANQMADSGCIAVTGGLEVASPRLLQLINKGISIEQVARVTKAFKNAGIYVHAYLMYGFPSQTVQETIDSLEVVRQLFVNACIDSGFWHRFLATTHSPVGKSPEKFGIRLVNVETPKSGLFARNEIPFVDSVSVDHDSLGQGLRKAIYNYMHGIGLEEDVRAWFEVKVPKTTLPKNYIQKIL